MIEYNKKVVQLTYTEFRNIIFKEFNISLPSNIKNINVNKEKELIFINFDEEIRDILPTLRG